MSNLLINPKFSSPSLPSTFVNYKGYIGPNNYVYYTDLYTYQQSLLGWSGNNYTSLQNGITTFNYPSPSLIDPIIDQFISLELTSLLNQTVNIKYTGYYNLTFYYSTTPSFFGTMNSLKIVFN
jgi:hypothetical protein